MLKALRRARADLTTMHRLFPEAERLARSDGTDRPGAEHLVLAALDLDDTALAALWELGIDRDRLRQAVIDQHDEALRAIGITADENAIDAASPPPGRPTGVYRSAPSLQQTFQRAVKLAKADKVPLQSVHVLLAATEHEHGTLRRAFAHLGTDGETIREVAHRHVG
jgi:ATP-dependent Clp protease ATP-binding subunit ClpA